MNVVNGIEMVTTQNADNQTIVQLGDRGEITSLSRCEADEEESVSSWIARLVHTFCLIQ